MIKYKNDGLAKGGFIVTLVVSVICIIVCFVLLLVNNMVYTWVKHSNVNVPVIDYGLPINTFNLLCEIAIGYFIVLAVLIIWALIRPSNKKRIFVGTISIASIFISWIALFFPVILSLVGSVLILCGRVKKVKIVKNSRTIFGQEPYYAMHNDID